MIKRYCLTLLLFIAFISLYETRAQVVINNRFDTTNYTLNHDDSLRINNLATIPVPPRYITKHINNTYTLPHKLKYKGRLPRMMDNIGLWYIIQGIKADMPKDDPELQNAISVITKYAEDRRLQNQINTFRKLTEQTGEKVEALQYVQRKVTFDSIRYEDDYIDHNDLQLLITTIRNDSNYQWLRKVSSDSLLIDIVDNNENIVQSVWINGKRHIYKRVWFKTMSGDTIRTWLETIPGGNRFRINIDESASDRRLSDLVVDNKDFKHDNTMDFNRYNIGLKKGDVKKKSWSYYTSYNLTLSQAAIKNWVGGGQNSFSVLFKFAGYVNYNKNRLSFENYLKYNLGMVLYEGTSPRKSDDYFEINSKLGYSAAKKWYYTVQLNIQTQLFNSYNYGSEKPVLVTNFMSPTYIVPSVGMNFKPNNRVSLLIAPASGKMTYIRDIVQVKPTNFGVKENKHLSSSVGLNINYNHTSKRLWNFLDITSNLETFIYYNFKDYSIPIYANWKGTFKFNINNFMNATLYMETKYDEKSSKKIQFKENLGIGFSFFI